MAETIQRTCVGRYMLIYCTYRLKCDSKCGRFLSGNFENLPIALDAGLEDFYDAFGHYLDASEEDIENVIESMYSRIDGVVPNVTGHPSFQVYRKLGWSGAVSKFTKKHFAAKVLEDYFTALDHMYYVVISKAMPLMSERWAQDDLPELMGTIRRTFVTVLRNRIGDYDCGTKTDMLVGIVSDFTSPDFILSSVDQSGNPQSLVDVMARVNKEFIGAVQALENNKVQDIRCYTTV